MLWQIVYSSTGFEPNSNIRVGRNGVTVNDFAHFFYCFVTVPSNNVAYSTNRLPVKRSLQPVWGQLLGSADTIGRCSLNLRRFLTGILSTVGGEELKRRMLNPNYRTSPVLTTLTFHCDFGHSFTPAIQATIHQDEPNVPSYPSGSE